ncbi:MAG: acetyl-CoA carboxylase biotin carboxyl carrier protein [Woeseiaceae bacterium]|jgi:acetyl-CoA carboxylase biotin carboxyl carrier protein|nr:acetyl-CoA carboxylase biotin carboxyl carrier protein [Woeseiaceae bacterium]
MDIRKVKKLIELLETSGIAEIEITEGEESVRISRNAPNITAAAPAQIAMAAPTTIPTSTPTVSAETEEDGFEVTAPMVGTYYAASSPGAEPFVQVGDRIKNGDTLCIIEAMKMMNPIEADVSGVIKSIRTQNGEPVEFGQTLIVIDQRQND